MLNCRMQFYCSPTLLNFRFLMHILDSRTVGFHFHVCPGVFHRYDTEATYFEEGVRSSKRQQLQEKLLQVMHILF